MKKLKINSMADRNFLILGIIALGIGAIVLALSFVFDFAGIIAVRGGLGLGIVICTLHFFARSKKSQ